MEGFDYSDFSAFLLRNGNLLKTVSRQIRLLKRLNDSLSVWSNDQLELFLARLKQEGKRNSYINRYIVVWNQYNRFKGLTNPQVKLYKKQPFNKSILSDEEIEQIISLPNPTVTQRHRTGKLMIKRNYSDEEWEKWSLYWECCAFSGMRMNETAKLTVSDIDFGRNVFIVNNPTEIKASRQIPIAPHLQEKLKSFIQKIDTELLFPSARTGKPVDSASWWRNFQHRIDRIGIKRTNLTPYSLRYSFCNALLDSEASFPVVMHAMGHKKPETTLHYTQLSVKRIETAMKKLPLIRKYSDPRALLIAYLKTTSELFEYDNRYKKIIQDNGNGVMIKIDIKQEAKKNS